MIKIAANPNLEKLKDARDKIAEVYEAEAKDEHHDNGNLTTMNDAILHIESAIDTLEKREQ
ncbi:unnamed protein product [marine sediment metagenome]|uniref:Uncharacterized protein n=1 Tax=marine sediment metagenome TaxID=412755 RepID=X0TQ21_9ZZZZ